MPPPVQRTQRNLSASEIGDHTPVEIIENDKEIHHYYLFTFMYALRNISFHVYRQ